MSLELKSSFDRFTFRLEKGLGIVSPSALHRAGATPASMARFLKSTTEEDKLVLYGILSNDDLSKKTNGKKIRQYQVGNPRIANRITARDSAAGLYLPMQLLVYEKVDKKAVVEYDLPSSLFSRFNNAEILSDVIVLENNLTNLIQQADKGNAAH